jgi:hypothetical protein
MPSAAPIFAPADEATYDLLALVADPDRATGRDAVEAFLAACRRDARANGGMVSVNRVRDLMSAAQIQPQRYSSLWAEFTGEGKPMRKIEGSWETNLDKRGRNYGKPLPMREWVDL